MGTERIALLPRKSMNEILEICGALTDQDFRDGFLHLASVANQNEDLDGLKLLTAAVGMDDNGNPTEKNHSLQNLLVEAMAVGKEITLRKLCKEIDPEGTALHVPDDWIGKGVG